MPSPTIRNIISAVAAEFQVSATDITGRSRKQTIAHARSVAVALCRDLLPGVSRSQIAREMSFRDASTILNAERKGRTLLAEKPEYRAKARRVKQAVATQP